MPQLSTYRIYSTVCALTLWWWGILNGQTVPVAAGDAGTVPIGMLPLIIVDDTLHRNIALDSLELRLLQLEITKAEERVSETSFWYRILPQIRFSASFGAHDLTFIDPASFTPYILPRDACRLTISLFLNDVLISSTHNQASLELHRLRAILLLRTMQYDSKRKGLEQQLASLQDELESLEKELAITQDLLRFNQLRFEQGKIEFDVLSRTKLELLGVQRSIQRIRQQQSAVRLRLSGD